MNIEKEAVGEGIPMSSALERMVMVQVYVATVIVVGYFFLRAVVTPTEPGSPDAHPDRKRGASVLRLCG
jgi:hypothetical protein